MYDFTLFPQWVFMKVSYLMPVQLNYKNARTYLSGTSA
jgi:hypothetical protein